MKNLLKSIGLAAILAFSNTANAGEHLATKVARLIKENPERTLKPSSLPKQYISRELMFEDGKEFSIRYIDENRNNKVDSKDRLFLETWTEPFKVDGKRRCVSFNDYGLNGFDAESRDSYHTHKEIECDDCGGKFSFS